MRNPPAFCSGGRSQALKRFEEDWGQMQDKLNGKTPAILDEAQGKALAEQQGQVKEFVIMGFRMAEAMTKATNE